MECFINIVIAKSQLKMYLVADVGLSDMSNLSKNDQEHAPVSDLTPRSLALDRLYKL